MQSKFEKLPVEFFLKGLRVSVDLSIAISSSFSVPTLSYRWFAVHLSGRQLQSSLLFVRWLKPIARRNGPTLSSSSPPV